MKDLDHDLTEELNLRELVTQLSNIHNKIKEYGFDEVKVDLTWITLIGNQGQVTHTYKKELIDK